jgi:hypothetical protein
MKPEEKLVLRACRRADDPALLEAATGPRIRWKAVYEVAAHHLVAPVVFHRMSQLPLPPGTRHLIRAFAHVVISKQLSEREILQGRLAVVRDVLQHNGIDFVLLKWLTLNRDELHSTRNLDLVVHLCDLRRARDILEDTGLRIMGGMHGSSSGPVRRTTDGGYRCCRLYERESRLLVNLHTAFLERDHLGDEDLSGLAEHIDDFWFRSRFHPLLSCRVLSREDAFLLSCLNTAVNRSPASDSFLLRNLVDLDRTADEDLRWDLVVLTAEETNTSAYVLFALELARRLIGTEVPAAVLADLRHATTDAQLWLNRVHLRCFATLRGNRPVFSLLYRLLTVYVYPATVWRRIQWALLLPLWAPPRERIADRFNLDPASPLVYPAYLANPIRWVYVITRRFVERVS